MKYTELKNGIAAGTKNVYLLEGDDAYFRAHGEEILKDAFLTVPELNYAAFDGDNLKGSKLVSLVSAVQSFPFMAEKRVIKIAEFYPTEAEYDSYLKKTFENFPETCLLIIVNSGVKKGTVDFKRKKYVAYVDCNKADEETVVKWIYVTFKRANIKCDVGTCTLIARYCISDMARVSVEVEKLISYAENGEITQADVNSIVYKDAEYRIYEMANAISRNAYSLFLEISSDLLKKGTDEIALLNSLFGYFKNLLTLISSNKSDKEIASLLGLKEYAVKKNREQAMMFGERKIQFYVTSLYSKLSQIKCGEITAESAWRVAVAEIFFKS